MVLARAVRGAVAGAAATAAMSAVMVAARRRRMVDELSPTVITAAVLRADETVPDGTVEAATTAAHFGYGIANGALFALVARLLPGGRVARGVAYAIGIMLVSYEGWVPAAGILPPQHRQSPGRASTLLAGHVVYGAVLGLLAG